MVIEPPNPFVDPYASGPEGKDPVSSKRGGKWDEVSVERDLPFIEEAIRILAQSQTAIQFDAGSAFKDSLRLELEQAGWQYNGWATFKSNFPFRRKYLVFDSSYTQDHENSYRIKVITGRGIVSDYKVMKWIEKTYPEFEPFDLLFSKRGILFIIIGIIVLSSFIPVVCTLIYR